MSQSLSRRSFLKCAGSGAVSLAAALLTGVSAAAAQPRVMGQPALLDGKAAVELLGYAPAPGLGGVLVYLSVEDLSARTLPVGASYLQSREVCTLGDLYSMGTGVTAVCDGKPVRCGSFARGRDLRRTRCSACCSRPRFCPSRSRRDRGSSGCMCSSPYF